MYKTKSALKITCCVVQDQKGNQATEDDRGDLESTGPRELQDQRELKEIQENRGIWDHPGLEAPRG